MTGCFPGFVRGWHKVPTYDGWKGLRHLSGVYAIPCGAGTSTLVLYLAPRWARPALEVLISSSFLAGAVVTYYWFRLPPVFGIGRPRRRDDCRRLAVAADLVGDGLVRADGDGVHLAAREIQSPATCVGEAAAESRDALDSSEGLMLVFGEPRRIRNASVFL